MVKMQVDLSDDEIGISNKKCRHSWMLKDVGKKNFVCMNCGKKERR